MTSNDCPIAVWLMPDPASRRAQARDRIASLVLLSKFVFIGGNALEVFPIISRDAALIEANGDRIVFWNHMLKGG